MIITRTPLRITLAGGGTDLPSYWREHGGSWISAAIDRHVYIAINATPNDDYLLKYAQLERQARRVDIVHPLIRGVALATSLEPGVEIVSMADVQGGTGLGSSGTFTVGLLAAVNAFQGRRSIPEVLAGTACRIDRRGGLQDPWIATLGGVRYFTVTDRGLVDHLPVRVPATLEDRLLLFFTGLTHDAGEVLAAQQASPSWHWYMDWQRESVAAVARALTSGHLDEYAAIMRDQWDRKRSACVGTSNAFIDQAIAHGLKHGASAGKLVGAGAGGYLMFYTEDPERLRDAMPLRELKFGFSSGVEVIAREGVDADR